MSEFVPGLEGVVAFETEIAEPDKEGSSLRYRGVDIEDLVGRVSFGNVWGLLVDNEFNPGLPPAEPFPIPVHSGDVRVDVQSAIAAAVTNPDAEPRTFTVRGEFRHYAGGVADAQRDAGVLEGAGGEGGQMRSNGGDHGGVEFGDDDACEARVPEQLAGAGAISTAEDEGLPRCRVVEGGEVGEALVEHELVRLGGHRIAVQVVEAAEADAVFHGDALERAGHGDRRCVRGEAEGGAGGEGEGERRVFHVKHLLKPGRCRR